MKARTENGNMCRSLSQAPSILREDEARAEAKTGGLHSPDY
ncbi:MAG: hypothetical protein ACI8QC_003442 [Planctomycetota bacterium]|jgi:hypothetical protein